MEATAVPEVQAQAQELPDVVKYTVPDDFTSDSYSFQDPRGVRSTLKAQTDMNVPNHDIVVGDSGKRREIRYIAGCEVLDVDAQIKLGFPRDYKFQETDYIRFEKGFILVYPKDNPTLYEYMEISSRNGSNPKRAKGTKPLFLRDNQNEKNKKAVDEDRLITKAKSIIYQIENDDAKLKNIAAQLQLDMNATPQNLVMAMTDIAKRTPEKIISAYSEDKGEIAGLIWDAMEGGIIHFTGFNFEFVGREGDEAKIKVPSLRGKNHEDVARKKLADHLQTEEGDSVRQILEGLVKKSKS